MARRASLAVLALLSGLAAAPTAAAAKPRTAQLPIVGGLTFKPGSYVRDDQRFGAPTAPLRSGAGFFLRNATSEAHTLSAVTRAQLPRSFDCPVCDFLGEAHQLFEEGPPRKSVLDVGGRGLDAPGDSFWLRGGGTRRRPTSRYIRVSARRGTTLSLLCIIHPWMQARVRIR